MLPHTVSCNLAPQPRARARAHAHTRGHVRATINLAPICVVFSRRDAWHALLDFTITNAPGQSSHTKTLALSLSHTHTHALTEAMAAHAELMAFTFLISALCDLRVKAYDQIER